MNKRNERTVLDNDGTTQTKNNIVSFQSTQVSSKKKKLKKQIATAAGAGSLLSGASALFAQSVTDNTDTPEEEDMNETLNASAARDASGTDEAAVTDETAAANETEETTEEAHTPVTDGEVGVASGVSDDMSFDEAFAAAREEVGAGGVFEWHGNTYNTFYATEWDDMSPAEHNEYYSHLNLNDTAEVDDADAETTESGEIQALFTDGEVEVASGVSDDMSFDEAFAAAREEVGAGGVFEWHGNTYNTFYATEWDNMSPAEHNEYFSHLNLNDASTETDNPANDIDDDSGVEVLGSVSDESGGYEDGNENIAIIDMNADGQADFIAADLNGDGIISSDELIDIADDGLDPEEFAEMPDDMDADGDYDNSFAMNDESLFMDDSDMPDYINDADTTDYDGLV